MNARAWRPIGEDQQQAWEIVATELGLTYTAGTVSKPPVIAGTIDGFGIRVTCSDDREGSPPANTYYSVTYPSLGAPIRIGRERAIRRIGILRSIIAVNDVEVGHKPFDKMAIIDTDTVETARAFLTDARREVISTLLDCRHTRNVIVSETTTAFDTKRIEAKPDRLAGNILGCVQLAKLLSRRRPGDGVVARQLRSFFDEDQFSVSAIQDGRR